jgi:hypothetical protein
MSDLKGLGDHKHSGPNDGGKAIHPGEIHGIDYLANYADNPEAAGTPADPYKNALENVLAEAAAPFNIVTGPNAYLEENAPHTVTSGAFTLRGGSGTSRPDINGDAGVIEVQGSGALSFDASSGSAFNAHIDSVSFYNSGTRSGDGLEFYKGNPTLTNVGVFGFDVGVALDSVVNAFFFGLSSRDNNVAAETRATDFNPTTTGWYAGRMSNGKSNRPALNHQAGAMHVKGVTFERNNAEAIDYAGAFRLTLEDCWFENNNNAQNAGVPEIDVTSVNNSIISSKLMTLGCHFNSPDVARVVDIDAPLKTYATITDDRAVAGQEFLRTSANMDGQALRVGGAYNTSIDSATRYLALTGNKVDIGGGAAALIYDKNGNGEITARDDGFNNTVIT